MTVAAVPACTVTIPTLVLGRDVQITDALVHHLASIGITDVDVATGYAEAQRRSAERDYLAVIITDATAGQAEQDAFCRSVLDAGDEAPGMVFLDDGSHAGQPPCGAIEPTVLAPGFRADDLRRAILNAVGYAGHSCKSAGLCRHADCHLHAGLSDSSRSQ